MKTEKYMVMGEVSCGSENPFDRNESCSAELNAPMDQNASQEPFGGSRFYL
jgi:hypothetical protein